MLVTLLACTDPPAADEECPISTACVSYATLTFEDEAGELVDAIMGEVRYAEIGSLVFDCPADGGGDAFECIDHGVALYTEASSFEIDAWSDVGAFSGIIEPDWRTEVTECGGGGCAIASERIQLEGA